MDGNIYRYKPYTFLADTISNIDSCYHLQVENILDLVTWELRTVKYVLPFKKKRKSELSDEEKKYNRKHSKLRVIVEHTVSRIKKFGIMGTKFRNKLGRYDHASDIVSGLVNFRIIMRTNGMLL